MLKAEESLVLAHRHRQAVIRMKFIFELDLVAALHALVYSTFGNKLFKIYIHDIIQPFAHVDLLRIPRLRNRDAVPVYGPVIARQFYAAEHIGLAEFAQVQLSCQRKITAGARYPDSSQGESGNSRPIASGSTKDAHDMGSGLFLRAYAGCGFG